MKVMIICGVFAKENEQEVIAHAKRSVEFSANVYQTKLIQGFRQMNMDVQVLSAPFIGSYPNASDISAFSGFEIAQEEYTYVPFMNYWGIRNYSRAASLKKAIADFVSDEHSEKMIALYSPHTPFLEAAVWAKRKDPRIKICMIVPDLPQYMNLDAKISLAYRCGKVFDIARFNRLTPYVDSFVILTEAMKEKLNIGSRPYAVVEGIVEPDIFEKNRMLRHNLQEKCDGKKYIVYTGKTNERFGVKKLVDAFISIDDPKLRLVLCGKGDCDGFIAQVAKLDARIMAMGQVPHEEAVCWIQRASVLVNPRENNEEYTKYSFPSKTIEYLASGNPVVGYLLDGMPDIYRELLITVGKDGLAAAIQVALNCSQQAEQERMERIKTHLQSLCTKAVAEKIVEITYLS